MLTSTGAPVRGCFEMKTPQACHGFFLPHTPHILHLSISRCPLTHHRKLHWGFKFLSACLHLSTPHPTPEGFDGELVESVLCYCRLQYYCCKKNDSETDAGSTVGLDPHSHFPCNACSALAMDGAPITPISLDQLDAGSHHNHCPICSPYVLRSELPDDTRNGGERLGFHTYYEKPSVNRQGSVPLSSYSPTDMFPPPPRPYSTQV
ncbi:hypothetical protein LDENG_00298580 [Lucifuga dentata]|nr:hypothetical protein LDENG_00298580 [Lucifuga dentata]